MTMTADTIDDFDAGFDDGEEGGLSGFYVLAIFLAIVAAFLVIVWFAYQKGLATGAEDRLPVVTADPRPVREEVPVALGTDDARRDVVYDRAEGVSPATVIAEANPARDPMEGFDTATARTSAQGGAVSGAAGAPGAPTQDKGTARTPRTTATETASEAPTRTETVSAPRAEREVAAAPARPAETTTTAQASAPRPAAAAAPVAAGTHVVQVGAFGSDEEALRYFSTLSGKHGAFVGDKAPDIQRAEVKGRTYHRLRLAPFVSKSDAQSYCTELKAKGQDCLVRAAS